jgi:hypothetical protein
MRRAVAVLGLLLVACTSSSKPPSAKPTLRAELSRVTPTQGGNFTLYVSNQSFARPTVDITVSIDGARVISQPFEVKGQHNWISFAFDLSPGQHELRALSEAGDSRSTLNFTTGTRNWAVLDYWCCDKTEGEPRFTFHISDKPIGFG